MHVFKATLQTAIIGASPALTPYRNRYINFTHSTGRSSRISRVNEPRSIRAEASSSPQGEPEIPQFALAPSKPTSPVGEMAAYYLQMQPHLFKAAVESEFQKIKEQRQATRDAQSQQPKTDSMDLTLSRRMEEVKRAEEARAIEDLMYICILEKFHLIRVDLLPSISPIQESLDALKSLTEGMYTKEALEMVKEHVLSVLGPASMAYADTTIRMSKLQSAQVYAASILFGYFLRRVDSRFQLAQQMGVLPQDPEDAVATLERLFAMADEIDDTNTTTQNNDNNNNTAGTDTNALVKKQKGALRRYVESFDQETMAATARLVTVEGAELVERQTKALYGDVKALQTQMQEVIGQDAESMDELMKRVQEAVENGKVENVTITVGTQRRAVLEAVAYGCFLRDVESWVDSEYALLTPVELL